MSKRANPAARNCLRKSILRPQGVCGKSGQLDGTQGPTEGCAYPSSNVWPSWGKKNCRISRGWFLLGNKRGVSVPWLPLAWLARVFSRTAQGSGRFRKTKQGRRGLTREMQFARTLDRRRAILDEGFELIECWEHDFKERPLYPKKKKDTFPHAIVFDVGARRCWTRANASRRSRICSSKASTYRCLFRWQTFWIERQSTSAAKIPKS